MTLDPIPTHFVRYHLHKPNNSQLADGRLEGYSQSMSYLTVEVEIDNGQVLAKGKESLPSKASGLLTILQSEEVRSTSVPPLQALETLQKHLGLDAQKADEWMSSVREARR